MSLVGPRPRPAARGRGLRPLAPPPAVDEARHHRPLAGTRPPRAATSTAGSLRPRLHRPLVALAGPQDPGPDDPGRPGGTMTREEGADHRDHRPGRLVSRRAPARQGLRGPRPDPALELVLDRADRPPLPGSARARRPPLPPLRRPDRLLVARHLAQPDQAGRGLQPGRPEPRQGQLRDARVHGRHGGHGHAPAARGDPPRRLAGPLLPGRQQRDVRQGRREPADRDGRPSTRAARTRSSKVFAHWMTDPVPRGVRPLRGQRDPLQPRVAAPRRDVRDPKGDPRHRRHPRRAREFLYVEDAAEAVSSSPPSNTTGPSRANLGAGQEITIGELDALIVRADGLLGRGALGYVQARRAAAAGARHEPGTRSVRV